MTKSGKQLLNLGTKTTRFLLQLDFRFPNLIRSHVQSSVLVKSYGNKIVRCHLPQENNHKLVHACSLNSGLVDINPPVRNQSSEFILSGAHECPGDFGVGNDKTTCVSKS